jgi:hypothetical protein
MKQDFNRSTVTDRKLVRVSSFLVAPFGVLTGYLVSLTCEQFSLMLQHLHAGHTACQGGYLSSSASSSSQSSGTFINQIITHLLILPAHYVGCMTDFS